MELMNRIRERVVAEEAGADGRISFGGETLCCGDGRRKATGTVAGGLRW